MDILRVNSFLQALDLYVRSQILSFLALSVSVDVKHWLSVICLGKSRANLNKYIYFFLN
jgi:hypothetical protein